MRKTALVFEALFFEAQPRSRYLFAAVFNTRIFLDLFG